MDILNSKKSVVIGYGKVGQALVSLLSSHEGFEILRVVRTSGVYDADGKRVGDFIPSHCYGADVAFLCIPSIKEGTEAFDYIRKFAEAGIPIVICEKTALANYYLELLPFKKYLKYDAVLGAKGVMMPLLEKHRNDVVSLEIIMNGALNFLWDNMAKGGHSYEKIWTEAKWRGLVQPGSNTFLEMVKSELSDMFRTSVVIFNIMQSETVMSARNFVPPYVLQEDLPILIREAARWRPFVEISKRERKADTDFLCTYPIGSWFLSVGFLPWQNTNFSKMKLPCGENNACILQTRGGSFVSVVGKGMGPEVTAATMIRNAQTLLQMQQRA